MNIDSVYCRGPCPVSPSGVVSHPVLQSYGQKQIVMEKDEVDSIKKFEDPGLHLIGFKPMDKLKLHHHIRPSVFLYPEEEQITGTLSLPLDHYTPPYANPASGNTDPHSLLSWFDTGM